MITRCPSCAFIAPSVICQDCPLRPRKADPLRDFVRMRTIPNRPANPPADTHDDAHDDAPDPYRRLAVVVPAPPAGLAARSLVGRAGRDLRGAAMDRQAVKPLKRARTP